TELQREHDRLGRIVKLVNLRGGVERRYYDAVGNLVRIEEPHGVVRHFAYDREQNLTRAADGLRDGDRSAKPGCEPSRGVPPGRRGRQPRAALKAAGVISSSWSPNFSRCVPRRSK